MPIPIAVTIGMWAASMAAAERARRLQQAQARGAQSRGAQAQAAGTGSSMGKDFRPSAENFSPITRREGAADAMGARLKDVLGAQQPSQDIPNPAENYKQTDPAAFKTEMAAGQEKFEGSLKDMISPKQKTEFGIGKPGDFIDPTTGAFKESGGELKLDLARQYEGANLADVPADSTTGGADWGSIAQYGQLGAEAVNMWRQGNQPPSGAGMRSIGMPRWDANVGQLGPEDLRRKYRSRWGRRGF